MKIIFRQSPCVPAENEIIVDRQKMTLREELLLARNALENAYAGFDNATDPDQRISLKIRMMLLKNGMNITKNQ